MQLLVLNSCLLVFVQCRPNFDSALSLHDDKSGTAPYRHRSALLYEKTTTIAPLTVLGQNLDSISSPLSRSEGQTGGRAMKKIIIMKSKKIEKAQGINIHQLPIGGNTVTLSPLPLHAPSSLIILPEIVNAASTDVSSTRFKSTESSEDREVKDESDELMDSEWHPPPMRSTLPPIDRTTSGEFNKQTFLLLSDWLSSEKEKRQLGDDLHRESIERIPLQKALARDHPTLTVDSPNHNVDLIANSPTIKKRRQRKRINRPFTQKFNDNWSLTTMSFKPLSTTTQSTVVSTTTIPRPLNPLSTEFVETLATSIEDEERELVQRRKEFRKRNYGVNPLMYKVIDGILYDRAGQPVRRVEDLMLQKHRKFYEEEKLTKEIGHDEVPKTTPRRAFKTATTPTAPLTVTLTTPIRSSSSSVSIVPLPSPTIVPYPPSTTTPRPQFSFGMVVTPSTLATPSTTDTTSQSPLTIQPIEAKAQPPFPFVNCYMNEDGFMCCNRELERAMRSSYDTLPCRFSPGGCSVQHVVKRIKSDVEKRFASNFEVIASMGDFAMHAHFTGDQTCKIEKDRRYIAAYATAIVSNIKPGQISYSPSNFVTDYIMLPRDRSDLISVKELQKNKPKKMKQTVSDETIKPSLPPTASRFTGFSSVSPKQELELLATTAIPISSLDFDNAEQLDAPSIDFLKPDSNYHRIIPFHERSRGKNEFAVN